MNRIFSMLFVLSALLFSSDVRGQVRVEAEATLDKKEIKIGEQTKLNLKLLYREGSQKSVVNWPVLKDSLAYGIEKISGDSIKNNLVDRNSVLYEQTQAFTITSFDSGVYQIPAIRFIVDQDTVYSQPLELRVQTVPVDTTLPIKDIKTIAEVPPPPPLPPDYSLWYWIGGGLCVLTLLGFIIYRAFKKYKNRQQVPIVPARVLLPHEQALEALQRMRVERPWEKGDLKTYHTQLAEILREYVALRWHVNALEQTTYELVHTLRRLKADESQVLYLQRVLRVADMVKFAKEIPTKEENEVSLNLAIQFVERTIPILPPVNPVVS